MAEAGRVIAGSARGVRLTTPGTGTRPLGDRAKQTMFAILEPRIADATVLDLFAGSGAAGIEALSRGAARAAFVERSRRACGVIARNCATARIAPGRTRILCTDVLAYLAGPATTARDGPFDVVIVDPPYADAAIRLAVLERLGEADAGWLAEDAVVVVTHGRRHELPGVIGLLASERRKRFGETVLTFYGRRASEGGG
jgi:16S rRNA (guanine(966)-N(2))-methyltransferase RsmD